MALRRPRRMQESASVTLTSMMDMMTIILVFLLMNFATDDVSVSPSDELQLPLSIAQAPPELAVNIVVSKEQVIVDGVPVLTLQVQPDPEEPDGRRVVIPDGAIEGRVVTRLYEMLLEKAEVAKALGEKSGQEAHAFRGEVLLQVDRDLPFSVLREIMYTAGQAQFGEFRFVVYKME